VVLVVALALAALGGVGLTQWVGRVIAAETFVAIAALGTGIVLAMARYLTATDPMGRQQLKWLAGGAFVSGSLALVVWFLPQLLFGNGLLPEAWLRPQPGRLAHPPLDADQPVTAPRCFSLTRSFRLTIATGARPFRAGRDALPSPARDQPKPS
jgi:hypothetical protein